MRKHRLWMFCVGLSVTTSLTASLLSGCAQAPNDEAKTPESVLDQLRELGGIIHRVLPDDEACDLEEPADGEEEAAAPLIAFANDESVRYSVEFLLPGQQPTSNDTENPFSEASRQRERLGRRDGCDFNHEHLWLLDAIPGLAKVDFSGSNMTPLAVADYASRHPDVAVAFQWYFTGSDSSGKCELDCSAFRIVFEDITTTSDSRRSETRVVQEPGEWESSLALGLIFEVQMRSTNNDVTLTFPGYTVVAHWDGSRVIINGKSVDLNKEKQSIVVRGRDANVVPPEK